MLTKVQKLILYSLGQFYQHLNQPLVETPLKLSTPKFVFIELLLKSGQISKQERAVYRNLETLEKKRLISYERRMIKFTEKGLRELQKISQELSQFTGIERYFQQAGLPGRKLQTVIKG